MVFMLPIRFVLAAGVVFIIINLMTPILVGLWTNDLRSLNDSDRQSIGDNALLSWRIMSYVVPGVIILWGFSAAQAKRVREEDL